jgi:ADP-heptose:LPS heptosyltransferase/predicted SAM-dependent methyltransferase
MAWSPNEDWSHNELSKMWAYLVPYTRGKVLDVGSGNKRWFDHWVTLDAGVDFNGARVADLPWRAEDLSRFTDGSWDAVVSSHVIEHILDWKAALAEWWRIIKVGGHLCLYFPHEDFYPRMGTPGANPDHKVDLRNEDILEAMRDLISEDRGGWQCLEDEVRSGGSEYSGFLVFKKTTAPIEDYRPWRKPEKSALVVRYGAAGDHIVASSILPLLKEQGYHVTFNSSPPNWTILAQDPHIDAFLIQDKDQVRNTDLGAFWMMLEPRYDRIINLCESVERSLLAMPGNMLDSYPHEARRKICNVNYMERTHDLAGLPHDFRMRFFPADTERADIQRTLLDVNPGKHVLWVLSGSAPHKTYPYTASAIVRLLYAEPDAKIILAGDKACQEFEDLIGEQVAMNHGDANRLIKTSGRCSVRITMAMAQMVDCVVGPETGVLNAVGMDDVPKVVFLSHSTEENLTKHWKNTTALFPQGPGAPSCYPCHRLMLGHTWERCNQDQRTGAAACAAAIPPADVVNAIVAALNAPETAPVIEAAA